ncbi:glycoside hydrolase family 9 protein [Luteimonas kalidii]|uniref:Endoglucanase n=1 Tax=Luteimonas kalidii TaxID=3042025 RepID=A0ABT6JY45_9GAMM|nr:glycoside hydrolase family 9 protein [Luteimonas kalidii]MDH5835625.1 glycoside hydrolase family 9 protein [Luteimonas kalidii]
MTPPTASPAIRLFSLPLLLLAALPQIAPAASGRDPGQGRPAARFNQLGFLPGSAKLAVVEGVDGGRFEVLRDDTGDVVLAAPLPPASQWAPAGRAAAVADLGELDAGRYRLRVDGVEALDRLVVDPDAYAPLADAALKGFYYNRAGTALAPAYAGRYARAAGHPDTEVEIHASAASPDRPAGSTISAPGGWYDAGDYNKYVVNSGITMHTLLAAWEDFPAFFRSRDIDIPESGDAVPDLLDEAWWNLRWMLEMQDLADGGVYHKLTNLRFDGAVMPEAARERRYVVQKGTAATLDFAAVMAQAARVYGDFEAQFPGMPARMREAAEHAWAWAQAHPDVPYRQPDDVVTGAYGDDGFDDEFAWAAAELFVLTGNGDYLRAFERHAREADVPSWASVGALGWGTLARHRDRLPDAAMRARVEATIDVLAARLAAQSRASAWRIAMQPEDFVWGSSAQALNQALMLVQGYRLSGDRGYLDAAQSQLDYVLGRNPLGMSFVTGYGVRTPMHIHHRPSQADGIDAPVPGLLSGGPNPRQQDREECAPAGGYPSTLPALSWLDHDCSYASNEIAINWNAPLVYVAAAIQALTPPE